MKNKIASKIIDDLSHEINNPNNAILLDAEIMRKAWKKIIPLLDKQISSSGDFMVGGCNYSELRREMIKAPGRIIRNSRKIKNIVFGLSALMKKPD